MPLKRREDEGFLRGETTFTDDLKRPNCAHLTFVRSEHAHAAIEDIDPKDAVGRDGVLAVYTWNDLAASSSPCVLPISTGGLEHDVPGHPVLAQNRVRYHGQPIAAVVAEDPYLARDGAEAVEVTYKVREPVIDAVEALGPDAPALYEDTPDNVIATAAVGDERATTRAFEHAEVVVDISLRNNRLIPSALEPRVAMAVYDASRDRFTVELASQSVHGHRSKLAKTLGVPERSVHVVAPAVGGGFGHKGHHHPGEAMAAWSARELDRPIKWTATRSENYREGAHGRDHHTDAELALDSDGTMRGLRVKTIANAGAYGLGGSAGMATRYGGLLSSEYAIPAIHCSTRAVFTTTAPIHSYRGAGRPEAIYVTERVIDVAARKLGIDPISLRRANLIPPDAFPYETAVGVTYDSGDYAPALDRALEAIDYEERRELGGERSDGRLRGVGVACYTESTGGGHETGVVRVHPDGSVAVYAGTHSHGQGHGTTYAQLVADELEIPYEDIDVNEGDSEEVPTGTGTFGSRSTIGGGNAVVQSAQTVLKKARTLAANRLGVDPNDVRYGSGEFFAPSVPDQRLSFSEVAGMAYGWGVPEHIEPGLEATTFYAPEGTAYTFGTHATEVAIDPTTGELEICRYVAVDDCGTRINPRIIDGQVHGGVAQGLGQARSERTLYDEDGMLRTDTMLQYALPRAADVPEITTDATVTPSPRNELGVKGIGEAGTIAAPPALVNAVVDALAERGVTHIDMPLTDEAIWRAIQTATNQS